MATRYGARDIGWERHQEVQDAHDEMRANGTLPPVSVPEPRPILIGYEVRPTRWTHWFRVTSPEGTVYVVNLERGTCDCPDYIARGMWRPCKHINLVREWLLTEPTRDSLTLTDELEEAGVVRPFRRTGEYRPDLGMLSSDEERRPAQSI